MSVSIVPCDFNGVPLNNDDYSGFGPSGSRDWMTGSKRMGVPHCALSQDDVQNRLKPTQKQKSAPNKVQTLEPFKDVAERAAIKNAHDNSITLGGRTAVLPDVPKQPDGKTTPTDNNLPAAKSNKNFPFKTNENFARDFNLSNGATCSKFDIACGDPVLGE